MALGPGKYDDVATLARKMAGPSASVFLIVMNGTHGDGFSAQSELSALVRLPAALRVMADEIEANLREGRL